MLAKILRLNTKLNLDFSSLSRKEHVCSSLIRDNHTQISHIAGDLSMNTSPWNKDRIIGQKRPLQISHIWGSRIRLELEGKTRDLALFNMALDSKLRGCDLVKLKVSDVAYGMLCFKQSYGVATENR
jgi:hypothetical protein